VLYYWCAGVAMRFFGIGEFAARLPSALAGLLAVVAAAWMALRAYGLGAAWYLLLMLPTSVAMIGFSRAAGPDMLFAGLLTAAMAVAYEMLQTPRPGAALRIVFGFFLGAAVLAKGPAAVVLAGGAALLWAALTHQWRAPFRFLHPLVVAAFCATALPWYVVCALRNPDFLRVFIWQHNFQRYTTPIFEHTQPFWFYGPILILAVFPWVLISVSMFPEVLKSAKAKPYFDSPGAFFACWAMFPFVFFSLSQSKLPGYILPAVPPIFIVTGEWISRSLSQKGKVASQALGWTGVLFLPLAFFVFAGLSGGISGMRRPEYVVAACIAFAFSVAGVILGFTKHATAAFLTLVLLVISMVEVGKTAVLPKLDSRISAQPIAQRLQAESPSSNRIYIYSLSRNWEYGLDFYFNRELPEWTPGTTMPEWVLTSAGDFSSDSQFPFREYKVEEAISSPENRQPLTLLRHQ